VSKHIIKTVILTKITHKKFDNKPPKPQQLSTFQSAKNAASLSQTCYLSQFSKICRQPTPQHSEDDLPPDNKTPNEPRDASSRVSELISIFKNLPPTHTPAQRRRLAVRTTKTPNEPRDASSRVCNATQHYNDHPNLSSQTLPDTHETCNVEIY
jgi:hypothetical protein